MKIDDTGHFLNFSSMLSKYIQAAFPAKAICTKVVL